MGAQFTTIGTIRQHFGNDPNTFSQVPFGPVIDDVTGGVVQSDAASAPFVGPTKDFTFDCPGVDRSERSVLMFQSLGVQHEGNRLEINPDSALQPSVFGGIPVVPAQSGVLPTWTANVMLVRPFALAESGNILRVTSRPLDGDPLRELDDFVLDNLVVMYKTRSAGNRIGGVFQGIRSRFSRT